MKTLTKGPAFTAAVSTFSGEREELARANLSRFGVRKLNTAPTLTPAG
jgi:hypothetical protein